jgi:hypothetical protein
MGGLGGPPPQRTRPLYYFTPKISAGLGSFLHIADVVLRDVRTVR